MSRRWMEDRLNKEMWLVSEGDEILARVTRAWRTWNFGKREFVTLEAAKKAAEQFARSVKHEDGHGGSMTTDRDREAAQVLWDELGKPLSPTRRDRVYALLAKVRQEGADAYSDSMDAERAGWRFQIEQARREGCQQGIEASARLVTKWAQDDECVQPAFTSMVAAIRALDPDAVLGGKHG